MVSRSRLPDEGTMATERLSMRKTREILRQKWQLGRTHREVAFSVGGSAGAVASAVERATAAGLDSAGVQAPAHYELGPPLYPPAARPAAAPLPHLAHRPPPPTPPAAP